MIRLLFRRLLELVPTVLVIVVASFALVRLAPGSPFSSEKEIPAEIRQKLEAKYGFDKPLPEQFIRYLGNLLKGDLGLSTKYPQRTVNEIIANGFPVTLTLAAVALLWSLLVGITAGIIGGHSTKYSMGSCCNDRCPSWHQCAKLCPWPLACIGSLSPVAFIAPSWLG